MSINLKKTLTFGLSVLMLTSIGAASTNTSINASHIRTHRVYRRHNHKKLHKHSNNYNAARKTTKKSKKLHIKNAQLYQDLLTVPKSPTKIHGFGVSKLAANPNNAVLRNPQKLHDIQKLSKLNQECAKVLGPGWGSIAAQFGNIKHKQFVYYPNKFLIGCRNAYYVPYSQTDNVINSALNTVNYIKETSENND